MRSRKTFRYGLALAALAGLAAWSSSGGDAAAEMAVTGPALRSVGALALGDGVLFVGDSLGSQVVAIEVDVPVASGQAYESIDDVDQKIAALLGTSARDVFIKDMVVERSSGAAFLSVMRGAGDEAVPVLLSVARDGRIAEVDTAAAQHSVLQLDDAPAADAKLYNWASRTLTITDLELIDGELFIAGLSNEEFASQLRRARYPFAGGVAATGLEIYHGAHGEWETLAPIFSFIPYDLEGKQHLLAGYLCTPLVTFPLEEVRRSERLRGKTIAELGWGNIPTDLVAYEHDGERYLLIANSTRGTMIMRGTDIAAAQRSAGITSEAGPREGVDYHTAPLGNVAQVAELDAESLLVLSRSLENGALSLVVRAKRWI